VFRQGKVPVRKVEPARPQLRPVPKELGEGLRQIADPGASRLPRIACRADRCYERRSSGGNADGQPHSDHIPE